MHRAGWIGRCVDEIPDSRPKPHLSGDEREQLESWLAFYRATLLKKCRALLRGSLSRPVATSSMSLLGILDMTFVDRSGSTHASPERRHRVYRRPDEREAEWTELDSATLDQVVTNFEHACETSDELAGHDLGELVRRPAVTVNRSTFAGSTST